MKQPKLIVEVRPRLQSCYVYYSSVCSTKDQLFSVDVQPTTISINSGSLEDVFEFEHLRFKPIIINGLKADNSNIVTFRVQNLVSVDDKDFPDNAFKFVPSVRLHQPVQIMCRSCYSVLLKKDVPFDRILPLPSPDFNYGDVFCHECCNGEFENRHKITPRNSDLFYGNYFFTINCDLLSESKIVFIKNDVYCEQCNYFLGSKESDDVSTKFWNCTVTFSCDNDSEVTPEQDFVSVVKSVVHDTLGPVCKLVIKRKSEIPEYLLLWVMDKHLQLFMSSDGSNKLIKLDVIKLMYLHEKGNSQLVSQWEKDISTHSVDVTEVMFTEGFKYLDKCNKMIPILFRNANNMYISYLGI